MVFLTIRRSFQDPSKLAFIPLYGALVRPHLEYGMPAWSPNLVADINQLELIQVLATRSSPPLRRETAATGPSFLVAATTSGLPDYHIQNFTGEMDVDQNLVFLPP